MTFLISSKFVNTPCACPKIRDKNTVIPLQSRVNVGNGAVYYKMKSQKVSTNMIKRKKNDSGKAFKARPSINRVKYNFTISHDYYHEDGNLVPSHRCGFWFEAAS